MIPVRPKIPFKRKRRGHIRPVSVRRKRLRDHYQSMAKLFVRNAWEKPATLYCPVMLEIEGKRIPVDQTHHKRGRVGPLLIDERFWMAVCQTGHNYIHAHIDIARAYGWICPAGQWNTPPKDSETERLRGVIKELLR